MPRRHQITSLSARAPSLIHSKTSIQSRRTTLKKQKSNEGLLIDENKRFIPGTLKGARISQLSDVVNNGMAIKRLWDEQK